MNERALGELLCPLLHAVCENSATPEQVARLESYVIRDSTAAQFYLDFLALHSALCWHGKGQVAATDEETTAISQANGAADAELPPVDSRHQARSASPIPAGPVPIDISTALGRLFLGASSSRVLALLVVLGLGSYFGILLVGLIWQRAWQHREFARAANLNSEREIAHSATKNPLRGFAQLIAVHDCRWTSPAEAPADGQPLDGRPLRLQTGTAEIRFANGARVVLVGPAEFAPQAADRGLLSRGRLAAQVPRRAVGFTINTPTAEIRDLGTEFSVEVSGASDTTLAVTTGAIELVIPRSAAGAPTPHDRAPIRVTAGRAMTISRSPAGKVVAEPSRFAAAWVEKVYLHQVPKDARSGSPLVAFPVEPEGAAGKDIGFHGGAGIDFEVQTPIRVSRLGVFDHLGDGIHPESAMTVQLWSRNDQATLYRADDVGERVLGEVVITAAAQSKLKCGYRLVFLPQELLLMPGTYSIVAYGFSEHNPPAYFLPELDSGARFAQKDAASAVHLTGYRCDWDILPGTFPHELKGDYACGSFEYEPLDPE